MSREMTQNEIDIFISEAGSRETSVEIMEAITRLARSYNEAVKIWENGEHVHHIIEIVTKNGMHETTDFCWGDEGSNWGNL